MICPICEGKTRVVEGRTPQWIQDHHRGGVDPVQLVAQGLDPAYVRWRVCQRCTWRFVTIEVPLKAVLVDKKH